MSTRKIQCMNSGCTARKERTDAPYCSGIIVYDEKGHPSSKYYAKLENSTTPRGGCDKIEVLNNQEMIIAKLMEAGR